MLYKILLILLLISLSLTAQNRKNSSAVVNELTFLPELSSDDLSDLNDAGAIKPGAVYNPHKMATYIKKYEQVFFNKGYLFARVQQIKAEYSSDSSKVDITVEIKKNKSVRIGSLKVLADSLNNKHYHNRLSIRVFDLFSEKQLQTDINELLALAADSGFVFARVELGDLDIKRDKNGYWVDVKLHVKEGERITINAIEIRGNSYTKEHVITRELPMQVGDTYSKSVFEEVQQRILRMGIFKDVKSPDLLIKEPNEYVLSLQVEEGNATTFDGVIGYIPSKEDGESFFTGLVDISFKNLFGTGRRFDVHWQKPGRDSENFYLRYTEPWVLGYPLDLGGGLERTVRDSTYLEWKGNLNGRWRFNRYLSALSSIEQQVVLPDSTASADQGLVRYEQLNLNIGFEFDTRDYPVNPRTGFYLKNSYTFGLKNNFGPGFLLQKNNIAKSEKVTAVNLAFSYFKELFNNQVFALKFRGNQVKGDRLQLTDFFWFGGARSLRGYRENQFRGDITAWINMEYRFLLGRKTRIFLFNDWGLYHYKDSKSEIEEILPGYGIGIRLDTALGVMAVDYGLGKGDNFSQAKIHFGFINNF